MTSSELMAPRWKGQAGRLEVWYCTFTDPASGLGCWIHHEVVAPLDGDPYVHGWAAAFRPGTAPVLERFGPHPAPGPSAGDARLDPPALTGKAGRLEWDVRWEDAERPLFTFPKWVWEREVLPAAQIVPVASSRFSGHVTVGGSRLELSAGSRGNLARIYGHGSAERWGWLHAELGGGDVLEVVSAVSRRPGLNRLPPLGFVALRAGGSVWPRRPLPAAFLFRTRLGLPTWEIRGTVGRTRLRASIDIPDARSVKVGYVDPDGATATCTNSEVADAEIVLERGRRRWEVEKVWTLRGTAHSEVGTRP
jgi:hypothetical protein